MSWNPSILIHFRCCFVCNIWNEKCKSYNRLSRLLLRLNQVHSWILEANLEPVAAAGAIKDTTSHVIINRNDCCLPSTAVRSSRGLKSLQCSCHLDNVLKYAYVVCYNSTEEVHKTSPTVITDASSRYRDQCHLDHKTYGPVSPGQMRPAVLPSAVFAKQRTQHFIRNTTYSLSSTAEEA